MNAALSKIRNGEYGTCELCTRTIDETRLAAMPYARLCLACKERQEKPRKPG
ncbi:MAG: TraR/DksA C4-type zinc finger protein [Candidatus Aureabacteria bacterium]|nr:TraR/DksA C4-type zinc finger protein [Candidatus Auribacterota bacterium]